ncbi:MAG TPA: hypothetical protein VN667_09315 [Burkholderiales bacterium]|nr:hypothetical protein [Burkholderiales bacterium]
MADNESWVLWELMGSTDGRTRGSMTRALTELPARGWQLAARLSSVGSDGHWPHVMALWRVPDDATLARALDQGWEDGVDEDGFVWGKSKLHVRISGQLKDTDTAWLVEYLVADRPLSTETFEGRAGPDLLLAERLAPWQGVALWGAADLFALSEREWRGMGSREAKGMRQVGGWWAVRTPDRDIV